MLQTVSIKTGLSQKPILRLVRYHQVIIIHFPNSHCFSGILTFASITVTAIMNAAEVRHVTIKSVQTLLQQQPLLLLFLHFLRVAKITNFSQIPIGRNLTLLHQDKQNVTALTVTADTLLLIGKALDGTELAQASGPRFQHHQ